MASMTTDYLPEHQDGVDRIMQASWNQNYVWEQCEGSVEQRVALIDDAVRGLVVYARFSPPSPLEGRVRVLHFEVDRTVDAKVQSEAFAILLDDVLDGQKPGDLFGECQEWAVPFYQKYGITPVDSGQTFANGMKKYTFG